MQQANVPLTSQNNIPNNTVFADFAPSIRPQTPLRQAITAAYRRPEPECVRALLETATVPDDLKRQTATTARRLIEALRAKHKGSGVEGLVHELSLIHI